MTKYYDKKMHLNFIIIYSLILFTVPCLASIISTQPAQIELQGYLATVVSVYDGDTFKIDINGIPEVLGENLSVRINGLDTPEIRTKCFKEKTLGFNAKAKLESLLLHGDDVQLINIKRGKYFSLVADVLVNGKNVAHEMISGGYGVPYDGKLKLHNWCNMEDNES